MTEETASDRPEQHLSGDEGLRSLLADYWRKRGLHNLAENVRSGGGLSARPEISEADTFALMQAALTRPLGEGEELERAEEIVRESCNADGSSAFWKAHTYRSVAAQILALRSTQPQAEETELRKALEANLATLQRHRTRCKTWNKSHAEIDTAIEETRQALSPKADGGDHG